MGWVRFLKPKQKKNTKRAKRHSAHSSGSHRREPFTWIRDVMLARSPAYAWRVGTEGSQPFLGRDPQGFFRGGVSCCHSVQASLFSKKQIRFPRVSGGVQERRIPGKNREGTPRKLSWAERGGLDRGTLVTELFRLDQPQTHQPQISPSHCGWVGVFWGSIAGRWDRPDLGCC